MVLILEENVNINVNNTTQLLRIKRKVKRFFFFLRARAIFSDVALVCRVLKYPIIYFYEVKEKKCYAKKKQINK